MDPKTLIQTTTRAQRWEETQHGKFMDLMDRFPRNAAVWDMAVKTEDHIKAQSSWGGKIMVSISGGSDSDIMMDLFERIGYPEGLVVYVWFDTGLEYEATKRHLKDLEAKYGVEIKRYRPKMTVAQAVKRYGVPVLSKIDAQCIGQLQAHGFEFEDEAFDTLNARYPRTKTGLNYWCNRNRPKFNVNRSAGLKEFLHLVPPPPISDKCCEYAKKKTAKLAQKELEATLECVGVRQAEGGVRVTVQNCFTDATEKKDSPIPASLLSYRPGQAGVQGLLRRDLL